MEVGGRALPVPAPHAVKLEENNITTLSNSGEDSQPLVLVPELTHRRPSLYTGLLQAWQVTYNVAKVSLVISQG
jgi:hypothetical protein